MKCKAGLHNKQVNTLHQYIHLNMRQRNSPKAVTSPQYKLYLHALWDPFHLLGCSSRPGAMKFNKFRVKSFSNFGHVCDLQSIKTLFRVAAMLILLESKYSQL
jgi:hypothetical protein